MKKLLLFTIAALSFIVSEAQAKKPVSKPAASTPVPKLKSYFGAMESGTVKLEVLAKLLEQPLVVKDDKNVTYSVDHFTISWTTIDRFDDPQTGEKKSSTNNVTKDIYGNVLTPELRETMIEELKKGDIILFEKITVKGKDGKSKYLAPSVKLTVQ